MSRLVVRIALDSPDVPFWQLRAIRALAAVPGVRLTFEFVAPGERPRGMFKRLMSRMSPWLRHSRIDPALHGAESFPRPDAIFDLRTRVTLPYDSNLPVLRLETGGSSALPFAPDFRSRDGVAVVRLIVSLHGTNSVVQSGRFAIGCRYGSLLDRIFYRATTWAAQWAQSPSRDTPLPQLRTPLRAGVSNARAAADLAIGLASNVASRLWQGLFLDHSWNIGILRIDRDALVRSTTPASGVKWLLDAQRYPFAADPSATTIDGVTTVFFENVGRKRGQGSIRSFALERGEAQKTRHVLRKRTHLSYPFIFDDGRTKWCIPESAQDAVVAAYALHGGGGVSSAPKTLLRDVAACDPTIVAHAGRLWLFCTRRDRGVNEALYLYSAASLDGPWDAHPANPVKIDAGNARPAGAIFEHRGRLYRPAQDCSVGYGAAIVINRIDVLNCSAYREEPVARIVAGDPTFPHGVHTLTLLDDGSAIIDGKRTFFSSRKFLRTVTRRYARAS